MTIPWDGRNPMSMEWTTTRKDHLGLFHCHESLEARVLIVSTPYSNDQPPTCGTPVVTTLFDSPALQHLDCRVKRYFVVQHEYRWILAYLLIRQMVQCGPNDLEHLIGVWGVKEPLLLSLAAFDSIRATDPRRNGAAEVSCTLCSSD
jgi:hypothetical protein